jgi:hypothetical protein
MMLANAAGTSHTLVPTCLTLRDAQDGRAVSADEEETDAGGVVHEVFREGQPGTKDELHAS